MRIFGLALFLNILVFDTALADAFKSDNFKKLKSTPIEVRVLDNASGGCWTNMESVAQIARSKLEDLGYNVVTSSPYKFLINVSASRLETRSIPTLTYRNAPSGRRTIKGKCFGSAEVAAYTIDEANIRGTLTLFGSNQTIFTGFDNANQLTLDFVQKSMALFE